MRALLHGTFWPGLYIAGCLLAGPLQSQARQLLNVDFDAHLNPWFVPKHGPAALGQTSNDFWNVYSRDVSSSSDWRPDGALLNLRWADGTASPVWIGVTNAAGAWPSGSTDPMMSIYLYPLSRAGEMQVWVRGLLPDNYRLVFYAHGAPGSENGVVTVKIGGADYGTKSTSTSEHWNVDGWAEGAQFVSFDPLPVKAGEALEIRVSPGLSGLAVMNGFQLLQLAAEPSSAPPLSVSTYAGTGVEGSQDGFRTHATLRSAGPMALGPDGRVYFAQGSIPDWNVAGVGQSVRTIDAAGILTTFAGSDEPGLVDGPRLSARFRGPNAIVFDHRGNMFISDRLNHRVRKIDPAGNVSTFAGSTAGYRDAVGTDAQFYWPIGMCIDADDNLYVADFQNIIVRKITPQAVVTTYAGASGMRGTNDGFRTGARFNSPGWVALSPSGDLFVADWLNGSIRKIDGAGMVSTFASDLGYIEVVSTDPQGAVYASVPPASGQNLFVKFDPTGRKLWSLQNARGFQDGPASVAQFQHFGQPAFLPDGNILMADMTRIRLIEFQPGGGGPSGPGGSAGMVSTIAADARFNEPNGGFVGPDQASYIADSGNHQIRRVDLASGAVTVVAGSGVPGFADGMASLAQLNTPLGTFLDKFGTVFVADAGNNRVRKISVDNPRNVATYAGSGVRGYLDGPADKAQFDFPNDLVIDSKGNIFISEFNNHTIRKLANFVVSTFAGQGTPGVKEGFGTQAAFNLPAGLAIDSNDNLYVTEWGSHRVRKVTPAGYVTTLAGSTFPGFLDGTSSAARFFEPDGIVFAPAGALYVTEHGNHSVRKILLDGAVSTVAGRGVPGYLDGSAATALFNAPGGIGIDGMGNLVVADTGNDRVRRIVFNSVPVIVQRSLPAYYWPGQAVTVTLACQPNPTATGLAYALEDRIPSGWNVTSVSADGSYDAANQKVKFGPYFDLALQTLTYVVVVPPGQTGTQTFAGIVSVNGTDFPIAGNGSLALAPLHPADLAPADQRITANELTSYGAAWSKGQSWAQPPNPIPLDYVTRAGLLWKNGEQYTISPIMNGPPLWWVPLSSTFVPAPAVRLFTLEEGNSAVRLLPNGILPGQAATARIRIQADAAVSAYAVEEIVPAAFEVSNVGSGGTFDPRARAIRWGPFLDSASRELTYDITLTAREVAPMRFEGVVSFDGSRGAIGGQQTAGILVRFQGWTRANNGDLTVTLNSIDGRWYQVESSTDLETWTELSVLQNVDGKIQIQDDLGNNPCRFYRLVSMEE